MLPQAPRQRIHNPQKGSSRTGFLSVRTASKQSTNSLNSVNMEFSFNNNKNWERDHRPDLELSNSSYELATGSEPRRMIGGLYTINPEKNRNGYVRKDHQGEKYGIRNNNSPRRNQYVNPVILQKPIMQDIASQQLFQKGQNQHEMSFSIPIPHSQKPLESEHPTGIEKIVHSPKPANKVSPMNKIEQNDNIFNEIKKNQSISFSREKSKVFPSLTRMGVSQPDGLMRLAKKTSDLQGFSTNLQFQLKKQPQRNTSINHIEYGHLLPENKLTKLKAEINQMVAEKKSKSKAKINYTNQTRIEDDWDIQGQGSGSGYGAGQGQGVGLENGFKFGLGTAGKGSYLFGDSTRGSNFFADTFQSKYNMRDTGYKSFSTPKPANLSNSNPNHIKISYRTSLAQLHQILKQISKSSHSHLEILVPRPLMSPIFTENQQKTDLYSTAKQIFEGLGIPVLGLTIKKYSNCILMVSKNICILWHYDGKVYLGGWQMQYLDEGVKNGLGLEWVPNRYVYYGEYSNSKKDGLGVLKTREETFVGMWVQGRRTENGHVINSGGEIFHPRISFDGGNKNAPNQDSLESDPFQ